MKVDIGDVSSAFVVLLLMSCVAWSLREEAIAGAAGPGAREGRAGARPSGDRCDGGAVVASRRLVEEALSADELGRAERLLEELAAASDDGEGARVDALWLADRRANVFARQRRLLAAARAYEEALALCLERCGEPRACCTEEALVAGLALARCGSTRAERFLERALESSRVTCNAEQRYRVSSRAELAYRWLGMHARADQLAQEARIHGRASASEPVNEGVGERDVLVSLR